MVTVLGIGNVLLKDEGLGVHFVRWFEERHKLGSSVSVIDGGTLGFLLLDLICKSERLVVVDALRLDEKPGSLFRFTLKDLPHQFTERGTAHDVTFLEVMSQAEIIGRAPQECVIIGIVPEDMQGVGTDVTPVVRKVFPAVEEQVLKELGRWGVDVSYKSQKDNNNDL